MARQADFDAFVRSRGDDLRRLAFLLTGERGSAERLVRNALVKCLADWTQIEKNADPYARARELMVTARAPRSERARGASAAAEAGSNLSPADDTAIDDIALAQLRDGLAMLRGIERSVVVLRVFENLSVAETAEALDSSERVVTRHLARALARVRSEAAGPGSGSGDRVAHVHRLRRSRRRRAVLTAAVFVALVVAAVGAVVPTSRPPTAGPATTASSAPTRTFAPVRLASSTSLPVPRPGGLLLQADGPGHTQLWVHTANDFRPIRAIGQLYDRGVHVGPAALDPSDPDRVVFVRVWDLDAVCSAPTCPAATGSVDGQLVWRLFQMHASTGIESAMTPVTTGPGPDRIVVSPDGWRVALATGANVDIINAQGGVGASTHVTLKSEFVQVLGFFANGGPLIVWETSTFYPGVVWASRQWVSAIDLSDPTQEQILYDTDVADCNPTSDIWLLPTDQLVLQTRCGPRPGPMSNGRPTLPEQGVARVYVADSTAPHLISSAVWGPLFRHDLQLDSTGTALFEEFEAKTARVVDRLTLSGQRTRIAGKGNPQLLASAG